MPVKGARSPDWNKASFWYEPWGSSGVHKGIDIFAKKGTQIVSSTAGFVVYQGKLSKGGKVILVLGAKWRLYYYAHLDSITTESFSFVEKNQVIGSVGNSGNAAGKPAHLHYSMITMLPYVWKMTTQTQGWKKIFFLDPGKHIKQGY
ncbi:MAG: metalloendopeptidase-like membrane protein [Osedax symbiont Rs1]|nr:MAG: metalloendopeptidase-like membrane protein [Osedax symbiont Rs1]